MNYLSSNLRCLRKRRKLSQQQLADDLGVKRSNIAAYETKNVEPRLSLLNRIAGYFTVPLADLILRDLSQLTPLQLGRLGNTGRAAGTGLSRQSVEEIRAILSKLQRAVDGFRVFYEFKGGANGSTNGTDKGDIDNFLVFIDHIAQYQQQIENALQSDYLYMGDSGLAQDELVDHKTS